MAMAGCGRALPASHGYVLVRLAGEELVALTNDDPLYAVFDNEVMNDPLIAHLLSLFEGTCGALAATNISSPIPQTLRNYIIIVIATDQSGLLHDVQVRGSERVVRVEYAIAVRADDGMDLAQQAREQLPSLLAQFLLAVAGLEPPLGLEDAAGGCTCVPEDVALWQGYASLQEERHALGSWKAGRPDDGQLLRTADPEFWSCCSSSSVDLKAGACVCGRGVAGFLVELLAEMPVGYPQRYMLWFANYDAAETRDAKLLLALARMPHGEPSTLLGRFVASYADTFPAEAGRVRELEQIWRLRMDSGAPEPRSR